MPGEILTVTNANAKEDDIVLILVTLIGAAITVGVLTWLARK